MVKLILSLALGLALLHTGEAAEPFHRWLAERALADQDSGSARVISFSASADQTIESLAVQGEWEANGVNLSPSHPPIPALENVTYGSLSFNGQDSALAIRAWSDAGFSEQVSVGLWIRPDTSMFSESRQSRFIVGKSASTESGFHIGITEKLEITVALVGSNGFVSTKTGPIIEPYRWHHVGFSWDGNALQIYIDGEAQGEAVQVHAPYRDYSAGLLTFGRPASVEGHYYRGEIAEFVLLPEAFSATP